jgi:hypothetical protein
MGLMVVTTPDPKLQKLKGLLPPADAQILSEVADEYKLTGDLRRMLFIIRLVENGGPGREMGVLTPAAQRFKGNHAKSLRLQAQWAAGTLTKRWTGKVKDFAERYCPERCDPTGNANWIRNASALLDGLLK